MVIKSFGILFALCLSLQALADTVPNCMASGQILSVNNAQVLDWKRTTKNQFHGRALIQGMLTKVYSDKTGHHHFQVNLGANAADTLEVVYNEGFGSMPPLKVGMQVEACGDYITANARVGHYAPSPDGALIHWVHKSTTPKHDSGFVVIDGQVCGQQ